MIGTYILPVIIESSMELVSNLEGYFEKAVSQYQSIPADSFIKSGVIDNAIEAIKGIESIILPLRSPCASLNTGGARPSWRAISG